MLLVLRALGLGDFLTGVPALRALRRAYDDHELVLATPSTLAPLVELAGAADRVLDTTGLQPLTWSGEAPSVAVNLHGRGPESHRLLLLLQPHRLVAFASPETGHRGPTWKAEEHEVHRWCRLLEEADGVLADPSDLLLARPPDPPPAPGAVVLHPGAAYPARRWPPHRFAEVAREVAAQGHRAVVTGSPAESSLAAQVAAEAGLGADAVLAGRTDLASLAAQVAAARLVVCGDTGVAHLASAYRTPSVLLFGPTSPALWGPPRTGPHRVLWHGTGRGDPWRDDIDPALAAITVPEVVEAVRRQLEGEGPAIPLERARRTTPSSA